MPKKYPPHKCENPNCGNITERKRFCSKTCELSSNKEPAETMFFTCINCGAVFSLKRSYYEHAYRKRGIERLFCKTKCRFEYEKANGRKYKPSKRSRVKSICEYCGNVFYTKPSEPRKFCCEDHFRLARRNRIKTICTYCGKEIRIMPSRFNKANYHFCNQEHYGLWYSTQIQNKNHPLWNGGTSFEPYCPKFNKEFKTRVRAFFDYKCAECGMSEEENKKALGVHHVIYNKNTCCDGTIPLFVPLCTHCHSKTNSRRDHWQTHFTELINTKYGGKCYYTKEEWAELNAEPSPASRHQRCTALQPAAAQSR